MLNDGVDYNAYTYDRQQKSQLDYYFNGLYAERGYALKGNDIIFLSEYLLSPAARSPRS